MLQQFENTEIQKKIFSITGQTDFEKTCFEVFYYQFQYNAIYRRYCELLSRTPASVKNLKQIPFLPIQFFKDHKIYSSENSIQKTFSSSGTTGMIPSLHHIADLKLYETSFLYGFQKFYGNIEDYCILALLPGYLEREGSSLVYMVEKLIALTKCDLSGFYLRNHQQFIKNIELAKNSGKKVFIIGVSYALMDVADAFELDLNDVIVMETGGMKGNRKEMLKEEFYSFLKSKFGVAEIHSEYGMTELLSQAYSKGSGKFYCPPFMQVFIRDINDPLSYNETGRTGGINVIDLANIYSCSFIETQDLGKLNPDGSFEVLGRFDLSEARGCNMLVG